MLDRIRIALPGGEHAPHIDWNCIESHNWTTAWRTPTVHRASHRRGKNQVSQIIRLPEDVLLLIFETYLEACLDRGATIDPPSALVQLNFLRLHAPFLLSAICHNWRALVMNTPYLWSYIGVIAIKTDIYRGSRVASKRELNEMGSIANHAITMIHLLLDRSREAPLHVVMPRLWTPFLNSTELSSYEAAADLTRRAFTMLGAHKDRWQTWEIGIFGALRPAWWRLALPDRLDTDLNHSIIRLPNLERWTLDHQYDYANLDPSDEQLTNPGAKLVVAPRLQVMRTGAGESMEVLCSSLMGPANKSNIVRDPTVLTEAVRPTLRRLATRSQNTTEQQLLMSLLRAVSLRLEVLDLYLKREDSAFAPPTAPLDSADLQPGQHLRFPRLRHLEWDLRDLSVGHIRDWVAYLGLCSANRLQSVSIDFGDDVQPIFMFETKLNAFTQALLAARELPLNVLEIRRGCLSRTHRAMLTPEKISRVRLVQCFIEWNFFTHEKDALLPPIVEVCDTAIQIPESVHHPVQEEARRRSSGYLATLWSGTWQEEGTLGLMTQKHRISYENLVC